MHLEIHGGKIVKSWINELKIEHVDVLTQLTLGITRQSNKLSRRNIKTPVPNVVSDAQMNPLFSVISEKCVKKKQGAVMVS